MKKSCLILICLLSLGLLTNCSTPLHKSAEKVTLGMDKSQVLDMLGSPRRSERHRGADEWTYIYYRDEKPLVTEIHFRSGFVARLAKVNMDMLFLEQLENTDSMEEYEEAVRQRN